MTTVTLSPKYQIVIPTQMPKNFANGPGEKLQMIAFKDRLEILPVHTMKAMRGFLKNMSTIFERE